ncbi:hypothetical protein D3C80_1530170 [compost metagenome]
MRAQFCGLSVPAAALQHPGNIDGDIFGEAFLFLGGGQPAHDEQVFGHRRGCAALLTLERQRDKCAKYQVTEGV